MADADKIAEVTRLRKIDELNQLRAQDQPSTPVDTRSKFTPVESGGIGLVQGATANFGDEIYGGIKGALAQTMGGKFTPAYEEGRDKFRNADKLAREDNPKSYLAGNVGGTVATALIPGMGAIKGAGIAKTAAQGAALGGLYAAGESEANPFRSPDQAQQFALDTAKGIGIGGVLGGAGAAAAKGFRALAPEALREFSNQKALTASGFMGKDLDKLSPEQQQQIGRSLLDNKVVTAFSSLDDIADRSGKLRENAGEAIGNALTTVDKHVKELTSGIDSGQILKGASDEQKAVAKKYIADNFQFNMQNIGDRIRNEIIKPDSNNPLVKKELARLSNLADDFSSKDSQTLGFGNFIKSTQGKQTRFESETVPEGYKQDVYRIIKEELENSVGKTGNLESGMATLKISPPNTLGGAREIASRNNQSLEDYKKAKDIYGAMKTTENVASERVGRQANLNTISLRDTIMAAGGFASGGPVPAVVLGGLTKIARKYGASTQAVSANALADGIEAVQSVTTDQLANAIGSIVSKSPELAQRVGGILAKAATEGKLSLVAVHYALMKDPEYSSQFQENAVPANAFQRRLNQK